MSLFAHAQLQHNYFKPLPLQAEFWIIFHLCYVNHPLVYCQQYSNKSGVFLPVMTHISRFFMSSSKLSHLKLWYGFCKDTINLHLQLFFYLFFILSLCHSRIIVNITIYYVMRLFIYCNNIITTIITFFYFFFSSC